MQQVTVRVPASTSNLGPGFDCLGVALRIYNDVIVTPGGKSPLPAIARAAADLFFQRTRCAPFSFSISIKGDVPSSRGLGGSVTVRLGVLLAMNFLSGNRLDRSSIFQLCAQLEGHPDNAAPAVFGGFTVVREENVQRFHVSTALSFVLLIPNFEVETSAARKILPSQITCAAAIKNSANSSAITAAFASGNYQNLQGAFRDHLHQPYRTKLIPFLPHVITAAEKAGALGAFLSGSGSTIAAVTLTNPEKVAEAMHRKVENHIARMVIVSADHRGARLVQSPISSH
jgi:homoserine kinase